MIEARISSLKFTEHVLGYHSAIWNVAHELQKQVQLYHSDEQLENNIVRPYKWFYDPYKDQYVLQQYDNEEEMMEVEKNSA